MLFDRSVEEIIHFMAKDLDGRLKLSWPVTKVRTFADRMYACSLQLSMCSRSHVWIHHLQANHKLHDRAAAAAAADPPPCSIFKT